MDENSSIIVIKRDVFGKETWRYSGRLLAQQDNQFVIEAFFNRPDMPFHGILLGQGDRFVETYYIDRWYNIFEIHNRDDDEIKGWYCNVSFPAEFTGGELSYIDLALDLLVYPNGKQLVLDEDEFADLSISNDIRLHCLTTMRQLKAYFASQFDQKFPRLLRN